MIVILPGKPHEVHHYPSSFHRRHRQSGFTSWSPLYTRACCAARVRAYTRAHTCVRVAGSTQANIE